ncbi:hypothetical protein [Microbacterium sp. GXF0217]
MSGSRRRLQATILLALGAIVLLIGTVLLVFMAVAISGMASSALGAVVSWLPMFGSAGPGRPVPQHDFFSPSLAMLGGVLLFLSGWVMIIRGATAAWAGRFDGPRRTPDGPDRASDDDEMTALLQL